MTKLEDLSISNTDIDRGLEYLPESVATFRCMANKKEDAKVKAFYDLFFSTSGVWGEVISFPQQLQAWKNTNFKVLQQERQIEYLKNQLNKLFYIVLPNTKFDFDNLEQEIIRLKTQELAPQLRTKRAELEQLIISAKNKVEVNFTGIIDLLLEAQKQINKVEQESNEYHQIKGQLAAYQTILQTKLTQEEFQALLAKQTEVSQLEKHLTSLQQNQEQVAQIQQNHPL